MASTERTFRGQTTQERRADRRARLLEAALDLIGTEGWPAATMTAICARAGLTERYFYESFKDRDALYLQLVDDLAAETQGAVIGALERTAEAEPLVRLRATVRALLGVMLDDPRKGRVALLEGLGSAALQERRREVLRGFEALVRDRAESFFGAVSAAPRQMEIDAVLLVGATSELITRRLDGTLDVTDDEIVDRISALALWATIAGGGAAG